jgi:hypothetical protein
MALGRSNHVEHALISQSRGRVVIPEPVNYEDGNGNIYERDSDSKGFLKTKSNSLEFFGSGADFLLGQFATKGLAEDVLLQKKAKSLDRVDERWRTVSETYLDMGLNEQDESRSELTIKTEATQGGIYSEIDSKRGDDIDITSNTSITGDEIGALKTVDITLTGREIFLESTLSVEDGTEIFAVVSGSDGLNARSVPFKVDKNSDSEDVTSVEADKLSANNGNYADLTFDKVSNLFYTNADQVTKIFLNGTINVVLVDGDFGNMQMDLVFYENGSDFEYNNSRRVNLVASKTTSLGATMQYTFTNYPVEIKKGDSLAIGLISDTSDGIRYEVSNTSLRITEDSFFINTNCRCITPKDLGDRLISLITGKRGIFRSSLFDDGGKYENHLITQGFYIRQFPDIIGEGTDEERKIQFSTSLDDFLDNWDAIDPIAWWVEKEGDIEVFRVESLKYTQQNFVNIKYGETTDKFRYIKTSKTKRKNLKDNFYSFVEFGSEEGGSGYEEVFGLQSVSGKASWKSINPTKSKYSKLSPWAFGDVDVELPRRKQYIDFPETDTKYDEIKNIIVCKKISGIYSIQKWQDIFEISPTNIYRVDSAFNLELTPKRLLLNHGFVINVGLYHNSQEYLRGYSSNCNGSFTTKKTGEIELKESDEIPHTLLENPRVKPKSVDFNLQVDLEIEDQILGATNGVPNWFGLVAVDTGRGVEYMRLVKCDTNKEGKHKLVEAFI